MRPPLPAKAGWSRGTIEECGGEPMDMYRRFVGSIAPRAQRGVDSPQVLETKLRLGRQRCREALSLGGARRRHRQSKRKKLLPTILQLHWWTAQATHAAQAAATRQAATHLLTSARPR